VTHVIIIYTLRYGLDPQSRCNLHHIGAIYYIDKVRQLYYHPEIDDTQEGKNCSHGVCYPARAYCLAQRTANSEGARALNIRSPGKVKPCKFLVQTGDRPGRRADCITSITGNDRLAPLRVEIRPEIGGSARRAVKSPNSNLAATHRPASGSPRDRIAHRQQRRNRKAPCCVQPAPGCWKYLM
jgi:hypothetical protein